MRLEAPQFQQTQARRGLEIMFKNLNNISDKIYENLTDTTTKYLIAIISLTLAYSSKSFAEHSRRQAMLQLPGLDRLLALKDIITHPDIQSEGFLKVDLPEYFVGREVRLC